MEKVLVLYHSQYGHTQRYARWIARALDAPYCKAPSSLEGHEFVIFGGALYAGRIAGVNFLKKHPDIIGNSRFRLFVVGLGETVDLRLILKNNGLPEELLPRTFYLRGGIDFSRLSFLHSFMMNMLKFALSLKNSKDQASQTFLDGFGKRSDFISQQSIEPLLQSLQ